MFNGYFYKILSCHDLPVIDGFYFRVLQYWLISKGILKFNQNPAMLYFHPKDLDKNAKNKRTF